MSATTPEKPDSLRLSARRHQRETLLQIALPVYGGLVIVLLLVIGVLFLPNMLASPERIATLSNMMLMLFLLFPAILCLLPLYLLVAVGVFALGGLHRSSSRQLQRLHHFSYTAVQQTERATETVKKQTASLREKIAHIEQAMNTAFDDDKHPPEASDDDQSEQTHT